MKPIARNLMTLYADLVQSMPEGPPPASISRRFENGKRRLYASIRDGATRRQTYLGTVGDPKAEIAAAAHRRAADLARVRRKTVSTLKRAGVSAPDLELGRLLEVLANAGLFGSGAVLIGTAAFQLYPPVVGAAFSAGALMTQDADLAIARLTAPDVNVGEDILTILKRADPTFAPSFRSEDKLPREFRNDRGLAVDVVTTKGRGDHALQITDLGCAATPLRFLEYLIEDTIEAVALYGAAVRVRIPDPARFAVHKLMIAQERPAHSPKKLKDIDQSLELIAALNARDEALVEAAIEDAVSRGRTWKAKVQRGMSLLEAARLRQR